MSVQLSLLYIGKWGKNELQIQQHFLNLILDWLSLGSYAFIYALTSGFDQVKFSQNNLIQ